METHNSKAVVVSMNKGTQMHKGSVSKTSGDVWDTEDVFGRKFIYNLSDSTTMQTEFSSELRSNYSSEFYLFSGFFKPTEFWVCMSAHASGMWCIGPLASLSRVTSPFPPQSTIYIAFSHIPEEKIDYNHPL